jgi:hypothetical protein
MVTDITILGDREPLQGRKNGQELEKLYQFDGDVRQVEGKEMGVERGSFGEGKKFGVGP